MKRPISVTFFGSYILLLSLFALVRGAWGITNVSPAYGVLFCAWGAWGAFCSGGLLMRDGACRRGVLWLTGVTLVGAAFLFLVVVRASGLEMILADVSGLELAYALNFGLLLATLFHLSDWRALEYTGEAHPTHG